MGSAYSMLHKTEKRHTTITDEREQLVRVFDALSDKGKKAMVTSLVFSLIRNWDNNIYLFLLTLHNSLALDRDIKEQVTTGTRIALQYHTNTIKGSELHKVLSCTHETSIDAALSAFERLDETEKNEAISDITKKFIDHGDYETYLLLRAIEGRPSNTYSFQESPLYVTTNATPDMKRRSLLNTCMCAQITSRIKLSNAPTDIPSIRNLTAEGMSRHEGT